MTRPVFITHSGHCLPNAPVGNDDMECVLGLVAGKPSRARALVLRSNGITSRHYAINPITGESTHSNTQLTVEAIRSLGEQGAPLEAIQLLACGTTMPDQIAPGHGVMVHGALGTPTCEVASLGGICVSGTVALKHAFMSVAGGFTENAVASGSERSSAQMRAWQFEAEMEARNAALEKRPALAFEKDFLRWMLSDGAAAFWLAPMPRAEGLSLRIDFIDVFSYAHDYPPCMYAGAEAGEDGSLRGWRDAGSHAALAQRSVLALKQDVRLLDTGITETSARAFRDLLAKRPALRAEQTDWFLPHYSSAYFRPVMRAAMPPGFVIPEERWFTNLATVGNVGSASVYLMIDELLHSGRLQAGQKLLCFVPESGRFTMSFIHLSVV